MVIERRAVLGALAGAILAACAHAANDPAPTPDFSGGTKSYPQSVVDQPRGDECKRSGSVAAEVRLAGTEADLRALLVHIRYPERKLHIPGAGDDAAVAARIKASNGTASITANDKTNGPLTIQAIDPFNALGYPPLKIEFDVCDNAKITDADFQCSVEFASDKTAAVLKDVTCAVDVP